MNIVVTVLQAHKHHIDVTASLDPATGRLVFIPVVENSGMLSFFDHRAELSSDTVEGAVANASKAVESALLRQRAEDE